MRAIVTRDALPAGATLSSCLRTRLPVPPAVPRRSARPARWTPAAIGRARRAAGCCSALWLVLFVGWLSLHWLILPHIEEWRPTDRGARQPRCSARRCGSARSSARSSGWVPALELRDVSVLDAEQRVALDPAARLRRAVAALAARARAALRAAADRRRRASTCGATRAAASASPASTSAARRRAPTTTRAADWFFKQHEFVIRGGTLRWIDEQRDAPPLALADVELVVRNGLREHDVRLDATPPRGLGRPLQRCAAASRSRCFARSGDWRRWSGTRLRRPAARRRARAAPPRRRCRSS